MGNNASGEDNKSGKHQTMLSHSVFIIWKPDYNLGIPIIDEQHRGIVTTINSLHVGMLNNYIKDMLKPIIDMMNDYTRIHFHVEEDFLENIDIPQAKIHRELHNDLSSKLADAGRGSILYKDPYQFMDFLKSWWINHICSEDLIFQNYLA
jgi:hemerythrin